MKQVTNNDKEIKKVGHFLLTPNLEKSPPNDAFKRLYEELGFQVDFFSPIESSKYPNQIIIRYGYKWLLKNVFSSRWRQYKAFSCTSEDPIVIAGVLAFVWRKPLIFLSDEIKTARYRGDRPESWKKLARWCMRRAQLTVVNDQSRVSLQRKYANIQNDQTISVYPGCFLEPPVAEGNKKMREQWSVPKKNAVLGFSGGLNLTAGIDWALDSLENHPNVTMVMQPLAIDDLQRYLLNNNRFSKQIYIQDQIMSWEESWSSMGGIDIGIAVYKNQAAQFQSMGISSNRLCMFLAMGVPVIVSKQSSFEFIEKYECGFMVDGVEEFNEAISNILRNLDQMKENARRCSFEYIDTKGKYQSLKTHFERVLN